jgi:hypothetical protein
VSVPPLLILMLLVSWTSLVLQAAALAHQIAQRASYRAERIAGHGYVRTAACRVMAAMIYVTVALLQLSGVQINGGGTLSPEALIVFTTVQIIWITNAGLDIRARRQLHGNQEDQVS